MRRNTKRPGGEAQGTTAKAVIKSPRNGRRTGTEGAARKAGTKGTTRSTAMRKADEAFSLFIRTRDSQMFGGKAFRCISCGRVLPISSADCGHYVNRQHMSLRYSELNCNAQCQKCNRFDEGNAQGYREGLIAKIGEPKVEMLEVMKHNTYKLSAFELEAIARHYKEETKKFEWQIK